ncbi:unnamed protein product, partial [Iphiclides podalirius]
MLVPIERSKVKSYEQGRIEGVTPLNYWDAQDSRADCYPRRGSPTSLSSGGTGVAAVHQQGDTAATAAPSELS